MKDKETGYTFNPDNCWINLYMESNVKDVTIIPNEVTVYQNDNQQFIAKVNGINKPDQSVKWEISGNTSEKTTISDKGMLSVPLDEEAESITVKATSVQDTSKSAEVTVTIAKAIPEVYWVKISPNNLGLSRGDKQTFKATVAGINNPSQEVVWSVEGNEKEQTVISQEGVLQIAADETANVLRVKAISKQDETKEAYVEVAVLDSEEVIYDSMVNRVLLDAQTVDLELGDSKTFTARVLGINSPSQIVEWTIEGNTSADTWIDAEGTLTIGNDEEADQITVKATSVQNTDKYATATINVVKMRIVSTIDDVAIVLVPGESLQFKAKVMGTNEPSQEVEWILEGNESSQTTISADGFLSVAEDETATVVMLTARSLADNTKTATIAIGIEQSEDDDGKGNEEEDDTPVVPDDEEQDDGHTPVTPDDSGKPTVSPGESDDNKVVSPIEKPKGQTTGDRNVISTLPSVGTAITDSNTNVSYVVSEPGKTVVYNKVLNKKIKKVMVPSAIYVNGVSYKVTSVAQNAFSGCKKLKSVTIGNGVTFIGNNAFKKCTSIKKIIIPEKVASIGKNAFAGCKKLKSIIIKSKTLRKIGKNAFKGIHKNARIKVPKNKLKSYSKLLRKAKTGKNVKIIK
ncbi:MAG: leucine-rich repeat protein [Clostridiales bacterium]|nr:leucine-rich repeat protein [Clostridiales bacterium]